MEGGFVYGIEGAVWKVILKGKSFFDSGGDVVGLLDGDGVSWWPVKELLLALAHGRGVEERLKKMNGHDVSPPPSFIVTKHPNLRTAAHQPSSINPQSSNSNTRANHQTQSRLPEHLRTPLSSVSGLHARVAAQRRSVCMSGTTNITYPRLTEITAAPYLSIVIVVVIPIHQPTTTFETPPAT